MSTALSHLIGAPANLLSGSAHGYSYADLLKEQFEPEADKAMNDNSLVESVLSLYVNKPCRICGELVTIDDLHNGAVFAGYSSDNKSQSAHLECWQKNIPKLEWEFPLDSPASGPTAS